jgi:hypothetical protein
VGGGPVHLEPGQWTDDTAMTLGLASCRVGFASGRVPMVKDAQNCLMVTAHPGGERRMQTNAMKRALERGETQVGV